MLMTIQGQKHEEPGSGESGPLCLNPGLLKGEMGKVAHSNTDSLQTEKIEKQDTTPNVKLPPFTL